MVGGEGARINTLGVPAVAEQTKPGDPLQVQAEPVASTYPTEDKQFRFWNATRSMFIEKKMMDFHGQNTARGERFLLRLSMYLTLAHMDQVYRILATALCTSILRVKSKFVVRALSIAVLAP